MEFEAILGWISEERLSEKYENVTIINKHAHTVGDDAEC